jgi:hypothetical protein
MALNEPKLKSDLEAIFDVERLPPDGISQTAAAITNAVISYLGSVALEPLKAPGINPVPAPTPDPSFLPQPMQPIIPVEASAQLIRTAIEVDLNINYNSNVAGTWAASTAAFAGYVIATFISFNTPDGYIATGATVPGPIALSTIFNPLKEGKNDLASSLAEHLHGFFTNCIFTGAYLKGPFVGPGPHVAKLI